MRVCHRMVFSSKQMQPYVGLRVGHRMQAVATLMQWGDLDTLLLVLGHDLGQEGGCR